MSDQSLTLPSALPEPQAADTEVSLSAGEIGQLSLWHLIWRRFLRNRLAVAATFVLLLLYLMVAFAEFITPYDHLLSNEDFVARAPQRPRFRDETGRFHVRPFVYGTTTELDTYNLDWVHKDDTSQMYPLKLFVKGDPYKLLGLFRSTTHVLVVEGHERRTAPFPSPTRSA